LSSTRSRTSSSHACSGRRSERVLRAKAAGRALSRLGAEAAGQPLLTTDLHLARAVREHAGAHVITHLDA